MLTAAAKTTPKAVKGAGALGNIAAGWNILNGMYKTSQAKGDGLKQWDGISDVVLGGANFIPLVGPVISAAGSLGKVADNTLGISDAIAGVDNSPRTKWEDGQAIIDRVNAKEQNANNPDPAPNIDVDSLDLDSLDVDPLDLDPSMDG